MWCVLMMSTVGHNVSTLYGMPTTTSSLANILTTGLRLPQPFVFFEGYFRRIVNPTYNIHFTFVDFNDAAALQKAFTSQTKLVWLEAPTNPTLKIADIAASAAVAHAHRALLVVDNTFLSPYFQVRHVVSPSPNNFSLDNIGIAVV